ncbi:MAG: hypothetical protein SGBAC_010839 [Bacillariaceae sp.]
MISNPNEAAAIANIVLRDSTDTKMNSANVTPAGGESNNVTKFPTEVAIIENATEKMADGEIKEDEEATAAGSMSLNDEASEMNSTISGIPFSNKTKLTEDGEKQKQDDSTKYTIEAEAVEYVGLDAATELNISVIKDGNNDMDNKAKQCEEEYDEVLHNLDDFDLYKLDYESDHEEDGELENLQSPVPKSKQLGVASWPNAAGGEILKPGDHVYMWCTMYQHHGIVLSVESTVDPPHLLIAEFTNLALAQANTFMVSSSAASGATVGSGVTSAFRFVKEAETTKWHKMKYQANPLECVTWRPGTCSAAKPCKARKVLLRVQFLHDCRHLLPEYHLLSSNCETVAFWCVTGKWETLQYHHTMKWTKGASVGLLPVAPGIAGLAAGLAFWHSSQTRGQWQDTEEKLNENFKWYALGKEPKWSFAVSPP